MKLATFTFEGVTRIGKILDDKVLDLTQVLPDLPKDMTSLLKLGEGALNQVRDARSGHPGQLIPLSSVRLEAPVPNPQKYLGIGLNYEDHAEEARKAGIKIPEFQVWFSKMVSCINGPYGDIVLPKVSDRLDYEAELGVVIGKRCKNVSVEDAESVIAGYFVANDVTIRDWQHRTPQWTLGKSFDTHGPCGPWMVTKDEIADPHALQMRLWVNGELRQSTLTGKMIYNVFEQIAHLSTAMTLEPGDMIATGTCSGVGIGHKPPKFLVSGDVVRIEIDGVGMIENKVVNESSATLA